jgi:hypothetical protein
MDDRACFSGPNNDRVAKYIKFAIFFRGYQDAESCLNGRLGLVPVYFHPVAAEFIIWNFERSGRGGVHLLDLPRFPRATGP